MAEVFGIVAGIVGVLDVGAKISGKLNNARKTWKNAATELSGLKAEIGHLRIILDKSQTVWSSLPGAAGNSYLQPIPGYMTDAQNSLTDLESIIASFSNLTETKLKKAWLLQKSAIESKKDELKNIRARVWDVMQICGVIASTENHKEMICFNAKFQMWEATLLQIQEQLTTGAVIDDESQPDPAPSINDNGTQTTVTSPDGVPREVADWSIRYRNPDRLCKDSCACGCHTVPVQHSLWTTPKMLSGLTGVLRGSTTWVPRWTPQCNIDTCLRQTKSEYRLQFELPRWIAICSFDALVQRRLGQPPTFRLNFRPRVNDSWLFTRFIIHDVSGINDLVTKTPDCVHFMDSKGTSPLMLIATDWKSGNLAATCNALVKAGADLYAENDAGINAAAVIATQYLLRTWRPEVSQDVFRELPMPRIIDELNLSPVSQILLGQSLRDFYTTLVTLPPWHSDLTEPDATGYTPIHWAALTGNAEAVRQLASHGVNVNMTGLIGRTPLIMLCDLLDKGHCRIDKSKGVDTIEALLEAGADTEVTNKHGQRPIELACFNSQDHPESITQRMMKTLIENGANTDVTDARGNNLNHMAISSQNGTNIDDIGRVRLLVEHGLSPNTQNNLGEAPIMRAIKNGNANICDYLVKNGADLGLVTASGQTIFHCAARCWKIATLKVLLDVLPPVIEVEVDAIDGKGKTAEDVFLDVWFLNGRWSPLMESRTRDCFRQLIKTRRYLECLEIDLTGWWEQWEQEQEQEEEAES